VTIRPFAEGELEAIVRQDGRSFGVHYSAEDRAVHQLVNEYDRFLVAEDAGEIVGVAGAFTKELTVPGSGLVPAAGVTWVSVSPTHRRHGILRALMARQLDDVAARGEPVAVLTASEGGIYERFGYGVATRIRRLEIDVPRTRLRDGVGEQGRCRYVEGDAARAALHALHDAFRRVTPGTIDRNEKWWEMLFLDTEWMRGGASVRFDVVHEDDAGAVDGYLTYRVATEWSLGHPRSRLDLVELVGLHPDAQAALWRFALGVDLVSELTSYRVPPDDPIGWLVTDPRQVRTTAVNDHLWLRFLDVAAALAARTYATADRFVLAVDDPFRPASGGRFVVEGDGGGASCGRAGEASAPDLALDSAALAAIYLGGHRPSDLARAGRVVECTPGALRRADVFFAAERQPYLYTAF